MTTSDDADGDDGPENPDSRVSDADGTDRTRENGGEDTDANRTRDGGDANRTHDSDDSGANRAGDRNAAASPWPDDPETEQKLLRLADHGYLTESEVERLVAGLDRGDDDEGSGEAGDSAGSGDSANDGSGESAADADPERVAELESTVERLREAVEERERQLQAKREEVDDYIETQEARLDERRRRLTADLVSGLLADVYGPLGRALDASDADALREGVALTRSNFEAVLADRDVTILAPEPGTDLDRDRHTVERTVPADAPPETVVELHDPGFAVEGEVIEKASVYVAE